MRLYNPLHAPPAYKKFLGRNRLIGDPYLLKQEGALLRELLTATPWQATRLFLFGQEAIDGRLKSRIGLGACELP